MTTERVRGSIPVTAIVLTLDEADLIERCVRSLDWADEVLVVDSGSADSTPEIAEALGARVILQSWLGWSAQRNLGAERAANDWVMFVEADEVVTFEMRVSIAQIFADGPDPDDGFVVDRRDEFMGVLLPQAQRRKNQAKAFVRLYNRTRSRWDPSMLVHEQVQVPGRRRLIRGRLIHWRRQTLVEQVDRMIRYSEIEAAALRARHPDHLSARVVLQPVLRFAWLYLARGEWRLGVPGFVHAWLRASADLMRHARLIDERSASPLHPPGHEPPGEAPSARLRDVSEA